MQYYDLLVSTARAIEKAGTVESSPWTEAMYEITGGDGKAVCTCADGIEAVRAGEEINYDGVTGSMKYTETALPAGIFRWQGEEALEQVSLVDGDAVLALDQ